MQQDSVCQRETKGLVYTYKQVAVILAPTGARIRILYIYLWIGRSGVTFTWYVLFLHTNRCSVTWLNIGVDLRIRVHCFSVSNPRSYIHIQVQYKQEQYRCELYQMVFSLCRSHKVFAGYYLYVIPCTRSAQLSLRHEHSLDLKVSFI